MSTPDAFNFHSQHLGNYLQALLCGLTNEEVITAANMIQPQDLTGYPHATTIWHAIRKTAQHNIDQGRGHHILSPLDVHETLVANKHLENEALRHAWLYFVSPATPTVPVPLPFIPELAHRVIEANLRNRIAALTSRPDCYTAPLHDLMTGLNREVHTLKSIHKRLNNTTTLKAVKGDAA